MFPFCFLNLKNRPINNNKKSAIFILSLSLSLSSSVVLLVLLAHTCHSQRITVHYQIDI